MANKTKITAIARTGFYAIVAMLDAS